MFNDLIINDSFNIIKCLNKFRHFLYKSSEKTYCSLSYIYDTQRFYYLGALKSNRKIFPRGHKKKGIKISDFIKTLKQHELDLVTVNGKTYYTYTYLGKIKGSKKAKIVISWPQNALWHLKAMKCFISLGIAMSTKQLLTHYLKR